MAKVWRIETEMILRNNWDENNPDPLMIAKLINNYLNQYAERYGYKSWLITSWKGVLFAAERLKLINEFKRLEIITNINNGLRRSRYIPKALKEKILQRDKECLVCGSKEHLCVDHIKPVIEGGTSEESNLMCLCNYCNTIKWSNQISIEEMRKWPSVQRRIKCLTNNSTSRQVNWPDLFIQRLIARKYRGNGIL